MRRAAAGGVRGLHQGLREAWIGAAKAPLLGKSSNNSSSRLIASSAAPSAPSSSSSPSAAASLTVQSPFWTLCGVLAIGVSAAAVGQRAAVQDARADRAEQRNAAAEAYAATRAEAEARGRQLAAVEAAARRELDGDDGPGARGRRRRRPWREVSEELWAAMSEGGR